MKLDIMLNNIDKLVGNHDFCLYSWNHSHGVGVWVGLSRVGLLQIVQNAIESDCHCVEYMEFIDKEWIPIEAGKSFSDALQMLEKKLNNIPQDMLSSNSIWATAVNFALNQVDEAYSSGDTTIIGESMLPKTFEEVLLLDWNFYSK